MKRDKEVTRGKEGHGQPVTGRESPDLHSFVRWISFLFGVLWSSGGARCMSAYCLFRWFMKHGGDTKHNNSQRAPTYQLTPTRLLYSLFYLSVYVSLQRGAPHPGPLSLFLSFSLVFSPGHPLPARRRATLNKIEQRVALTSRVTTPLFSPPVTLLLVFPPPPPIPLSHRTHSFAFSVHPVEFSVIQP